MINRLLQLIVTWSFTNRYEFRFNYNTRQQISPWYSINSWSTLESVNVIEKEFKTKTIQDILYTVNKKPLLCAKEHRS
jgi:hypothetical protein